VDADGREVAITAGRERILLAMLLLHANQPLSTDLLVDTIWATEVPHNARNQLQTCIHRLRRHLHEPGSDRQLIVTEPAGYRINVDPEDLDLYEFRRLVGEARAAASTGSHHDAKSGYRAALDLWRGPALPSIDSHLIRAAAAGLDEERVQALEECLDSELAAGGAGELVAELTELVAQHPHRERLHRGLMLALYRAGRQADALAAYRHARQLLYDQLGTEPSAELQRLHHAILNRDPSLDAVRPPGPATAAPLPTPRELPPDVAGFTGRIEALKALDELQPPDDLTGPIVISAIAGTAGVGKTALAVHWAHRVAKRFPDGQLYLNLRGYATGAPLRPIEALAMMLRSLGMGPDQLPTEEAEASARFRSLLADRRVLVVLDNARSVEQVRPLLPGGSGCLALVTSRDRLGGLVARDGARRLTLDVLPADEAYTLLARLLGNDRVAGEPAATAQLAGACAYLPLALRIAAAALIDHPSRRIQDLVSDLNNGQRLAALEVEGDQDTAVRAALDLSYRAIPEPAQRLFRLLGLVPGPDFTPDAVAALADLPLDEAQRLLDRLASANLVEEHLPGRYTFHDLLREYATYLAERGESEHDRASATERLLEWYLATTGAASRQLHPTAARLPVPGPHGPEARPPFGSDRTDTLAWLDSERPNLIATVRHAALQGPHEVAWLLTDSLRLYLWTGKHNIEGLALGHAATTAARAAADPAGQASAQLVLAMAHQGRGDYAQSQACGAAAIVLARRAGWREGEAAATNHVASTSIMDGRLDEAVEYLTRALAINQDLGRRGAQGVNIAQIGIVQFEAGDLAASVPRHTEALAISRETDNRSLEAVELNNLGVGHSVLGNLDESLRYFGEALALAREVSDPTLESMTLCSTAVVHHVAGRYREALALIDSSSTLARSIGDKQQDAYPLNILARVHNSLGDHRRAVADLTEVLSLVQDDRPFARTEALIDLAIAHTCLAEYDQASEAAHDALALSRKMGYRMREGQVLTALAEIRLGQARRDDARAYAEAALESHRTTGYRLGEAQTLAVLGRLELAGGDPAAAQRLRKAARELFEDIGAPMPADVREGLRRA
jgi:DNA-binding SARP family transcriptional activator